MWFPFSLPLLAWGTCWWYDGQFYESVLGVDAMMDALGIGVQSMVGHCYYVSCSLILSLVGGDDCTLQRASLLPSADPNRSEGHLCDPPFPDMRDPWSLPHIPGKVPTCGCREEPRPWQPLSLSHIYIAGGMETV